ncbi:MAG: DUF4349 domain-containing protein [Candidatus Acidiferrales bacterium]
MDRSVQHAFDAEEIMAYLDGELEPQRAAALAAHLVGCGECQEIAKSFRAVSERMLNFEVELAAPQMSKAVLAALESFDTSRTTVERGSYKNEISVWDRLRSPRYAWTFAGALVALAILVVGIPALHRSGEDLTRTVALSRSEPAFHASQTLQESYADKAERSQSTESAEALPAPPPPPPGGELQAPEIVGPMIAQTASLNIVATNYDEASAAIERLAAAHGGYVEKLDAKAQTGSARELSATLRIPAKQLDGFLADLRKLGHVEEESRGNEEVSAQYVDLQARLKAARATEQRLIELLGTRTGKLSDVLEAERELARVRGEIESMQGQNAVLVHRVSYATVEVELSEVYRERLTTDSKGTKIRNALVEGLSNVEDGAVSLLLFLLAYGPSILFWLAILLIPGWLIWRRLRSRVRA